MSIAEGPSTSRADGPPAGIPVPLSATLTGAGLGLPVVAGPLAALDWIPAGPDLGIPVVVLALALAVAGVGVAAFHTGLVARVWRGAWGGPASCLSREGAATVLALPAALLFAWDCLGGGRPDGPLATGSVLAAMLAASSVIGAVMICASLRVAHPPRHPLAFPHTLAVTLMNGALVLHALQRGYDVNTPATGWLAVALIVLAAIVRFELERALGAARPSAAITARRRWTWTLGHALPLVGTLAAIALPSAPGAVPALAAALSAIAGAVLTRRLFLAETRSVKTA